MSQLIDEFKQEHLQLSDLFLRARQQGTDSDAVKEAILNAKKMLLAHLNKEDRFLYPALRDAAITDPSVRQTADDYALDMDTISIEVMAFFNLYESGNGCAEQFKTDCDHIIVALTERIIKEESVLYPLYNKVVAHE